jgi:hypothetical protein
MVALAELSGQLSIQKERNVRLDGSGAHRIVRNQPADRRLNKGYFLCCEKYVP